MAKDKLDGVKNFFQNALYVLNKSTKKIVAKIDELDPTDNTRKRVISSLILVPIAIYAICFSQSLFTLIAIIAAVLMALEWADLTKAAQDQKKWRLIGLAYIVIPIYCVIKLRAHDSNILLWMFAVIWTTDIFAFFSGKSFGGPKLAPSISPNKTWTGLAGGVFASMIIGFLSSFMFHGGVLFFVLFSAFLALVEQTGDLLESKFKRIFGAKDSGNIIPGHGGILDRLDGVMLSAPFVMLLITLFSDKF